MNTQRSLASLPAPRGLPFFGNLLQFDARRMHEILERWARELGTPYRLRLGPREMLVIDDPRLIGEILKARPGVFRRGRPVESVFREMGIAGVFSSEGENWERQRRLVMRAFDPTRLRGYFPNLVTVTRRLRNRWVQAARDGRALDIQTELMRYTVDVTAGLAFGVEINTIESDDQVIQQHLEKVFPALSRRLNAPYPYWRHFKLPRDRDLDRSLAVILESIESFIAAARKRLANDASLREKPANLIEALLVARDQPGSEFTDQDVSGNIFTALLAGEDTTANTLAWLCHYLCDHPQVQIRMAAEADAMLADADVITRFEQAAQAPYIDAATREAMRLKPVAPVLFFESNEATRVGDIEIAARTPITTLMRPPAIDEAVFPDALAFRPERWLAGGANETETAESKRALMPFGGGPRFCPGRYLALLEIRMVASMLVHNFSLQRRPGTQATERYNLSMMPEGLWVQLEERTQAATRLSPA